MHNNPVQTLDTGPEPDWFCILAHGRGGSAADMRELARALGVHGVRFLLPQADNHTWYPQRFLAPLEANAPWLSAAIAQLERIVTGLIGDGIPAGRIFVGGFSQGGCLAAEYLCRHPRPYAGGLIFTGGLIGPPGTVWPVSTALKGVPVLLTSSEADDWVPAARVRETEAWLRRCEARPDMTIFAQRPHAVIVQEIVRARTLIETVMAPAH